MRYHIYWFPSLKQKELNFRLNRSLLLFVEFADTFHLQRREEQNTRTKQISFLVVGSHNLTTKISLRKTQHKHKILSRRHLCSLNYKKVQTKKKIMKKYIQKQEPQPIEHVTTWHGFPLSRHIKLPFYSPLHDNASAENVV